MVLPKAPYHPPHTGMTSTWSRPSLHALVPPTHPVAPSLPAPPVSSHSSLPSLPLWKAATGFFLPSEGKKMVSSTTPQVLPFSHPSKPKHLSLLSLPPHFLPPLSVYPSLEATPFPLACRFCGYNQIITFIKFKITF